MTDQMTMFTLPRSVRRDKNRLRRWYDSVNKSKIDRAAKGYCLHLGRRSDPAAKHVWGGQQKLAKEMGCSVRQIQRYQRQCEEAGLFDVVRGPVIRESDGTLHRAHCNRYIFCVPPGISRKGKPRSDRSDTNVTYNNSLTRVREKTLEISFARIPPPLPDHDKCGGAGWIDTGKGYDDPCECLLAGQN